MAMVISSYNNAIMIYCCNQKGPSNVSKKSHHYNKPLSSIFKSNMRSTLRQVSLQQIDVMKNNVAKLLDVVVDSLYDFIDKPYIPSKSNFAPVEELGEAIPVACFQGQIPTDFPEGIYIRNGPNPLFGGFKSTKSIFGKSSHIWVEGEGMLHALYFQKSSHGSWTVIYNNKHVETETYNLEKQRNKPLFLPSTEGNSLAILSAYFFNWLRTGIVDKYISNTNVFEHSGKFYSVAESHMPQEIDIFSLITLNNWELSASWNRPFTSHPKKAPGTGELVIIGVEPIKPFAVIGIISADGKELVHKVDIKQKRCSLCHEIGVTQRYNVIMDFPLTIDLNRLLIGGQVLKYNKNDYARIGIMPRYGNADSIKWFEVEPNCTFHIINSFEDGNEIVVRGCRSLDTVIPKPNPSSNEFDWFSRCYEWRLNMKTGGVKEKDLCGDKVVYMDFPMINEKFVGIKHKYAYTKLVDPIASSKAEDEPKYGGLAKLYLEEFCDQLSLSTREMDEAIKMEYHMFEKNTFCSGATFVARDEGVDEDDGWIITFVHNEDTNTSQVYIIDTKNFCGEAVAKIAMPCRVPYGFHGAFMPVSFQD